MLVTNVCAEARAPPLPIAVKTFTLALFYQTLFCQYPGMTTRKEMSWMQTYPALRCAGNHFNG